MYYAINKDRRIDVTKRIDTTIVKTKKNFSAPRFVWYVALPSPPPKAPPSSVPDCCISMPSMRRTASIACAHGKITENSI